MPLPKSLDIIAASADGASHRACAFSRKGGTRLAMLCGLLLLFSLSATAGTICFIGDCSTTGTTQTVTLTSVNTKTGAITVSLNGMTATLTANTGTVWLVADLNQLPPSPLRDAWIEWNDELAPPFSLAGMLHAAKDLAHAGGDVAIAANADLTIASIQPVP